jgi:ribosomal protein L34
LRLVDVTSGDGTSISETVVRDILINEQARNWYIEVSDPPRSFRVDFGFLTPSGHFHRVLSSNVVTTPRANVSDRIDEAWADLPENYERILAMSAGFQPGTSSEEVRRRILERLQRPMASGFLASMASEALARQRGQRGFWFQVEAELIIYGATEPGAKVTLQGEPVTLRPDGTFSVRMALPNGRQIIPAVAISPDGLEERTIVLAIERNTKALEPVLREILAEA